MPTKQENAPLANKGLAEALREAREALKTHALVEDYDYPGDTAVYAGTICQECFADVDGGQHKPSCVFAKIDATLAVLSAQPAGDATDAEGLERAHLAELIFNHIADIGSEPFVVVKDGDGWLTRTLAAHDVLRTHPPKPEAGEGDFAKTLARELREQSRYPSGAPRISLETAESIVREALSRTSQANEGEGAAEHSRGPERRCLPARSFRRHHGICPSNQVSL